MTHGTNRCKTLPRDWSRRRRIVLQRDSHICWICGEAGANSVDHVIPSIKGGSSEYHNLKAAHLSCNVKRTSHMRRPNGQRGATRQGRNDWLPLAKVPERWG